MGLDLSSVTISSTIYFIEQAHSVGVKTSPMRRCDAASVDKHREQWRHTYPSGDTRGCEKLILADWFRGLAIGVAQFASRPLDHDPKRASLLLGPAGVAGSL